MAFWGGFFGTITGFVLLCVVAVFTKKKGD